MPEPTHVMSPVDEPGTLHGHDEPGTRYWRAAYDEWVRLHGPMEFDAQDKLQAEEGSMVGVKAVCFFHQLEELFSFLTSAGCPLDAHGCPVEVGGPNPSTIREELKGALKAGNRWFFFTHGKRLTVACVDSPAG